MVSVEFVLCVASPLTLRDLSKRSPSKLGFEQIDVTQSFFGARAGVLEAAFTKNVDSGRFIKWKMGKAQLARSSGGRLSLKRGVLAMKDVLPCL